MKKVIGRSEKLRLIDLDDISIESKIDTGAFSNAIHVDDVSILNGVLSFRIGESQFLFSSYKTIEVKSSFGHKEMRFSILTRIKLGKKKYKTYICLTKRPTMKYKMLIGRKFLYKFGYVVDVTKKNTYDTLKEV